MFAPLGDAPSWWLLSAGYARCARSPAVKYGWPAPRTSEGSEKRKAVLAEVKREKRKMKNVDSARCPRERVATTLPCRRPGGRPRRVAPTADRFHNFIISFLFTPLPSSAWVNTHVFIRREACQGRGCRGGRGGLRNSKPLPPCRKRKEKSEKRKVKMAEGGVGGGAHPYPAENFIIS